MRPRTLLPLAVAAAIVGCPLPQPLPDYPPGTITPPRILASTTGPYESIIPVPADCAIDPEYNLGAKIFYQDSVTIEARWFVDYKKDVDYRYVIHNPYRDVPPNPDPTILERDVPGFTFRPYQYPIPAEATPPGATSWKSPGVVHVVELVVSNGFDPSPFAPEPNRTPALTPGMARFEIQTYRWTLVNVAGLTCP